MAWAYQGLGTAWMYKGFMERAIENFDRAIENKPSLAWAYCNRGIARVYLGQEPQAQADLDECVKLRPDLKSEVERRAGLARSLRRIGKQEETSFLLIVVQAEALDGSRATASFVDIDDRRADAHLTTRMLSAFRDHRRETRNHISFVHSDHSGIAARHSKIS